MVDGPATTVNEAHMFEAHYDRHVWLFRENPNGIFAQFNPAVSCAHQTGGQHAHASSVVGRTAAAPPTVPPLH